MDIRLTEDQRAIADNVAKVCSEFDDNYWSGCEADMRFPEEFVQAMADGSASPCRKLMAGRAWGSPKLLS